MSTQELQDGLWHWRAPHPDWRPSEPWDPNVSSYAVDDGKHLILVDPLAVPDALLALAAEREAAVVLTCPWHERDARRLVEALGAPIYTPLPDTAEDLMRKFGVTAERAGDGSPDLIWLLREGQGEARPFVPGDRLPFGVDVYPGQWPNDTVLWIEGHRAVISGDTLVDFGRGLEVNLRWRRDAEAREEIVSGLRPLLALPVEHLLTTHGGPMDRAALERVLS